jgi:hypothetical protein
MLLNFIAFGLIRKCLEPMEYHTQGEHANHYITNVVQTGLEPMEYHTQGEHANHYTTNVVHSGWNPWRTTLKVSMLTITLPM